MRGGDGVASEAVMEDVDRVHVHGCQGIGHVQGEIDAGAAAREDLVDGGHVRRQLPALQRRPSAVVVLPWKACSRETEPPHHRRLLGLGVEGRRSVEP